MADFSGEYTHSIDSKGRLNVPAKYRKALPPHARDVLVVTLWFEGCLAVYSLDDWERLKGDLRRLPVTGKAARRYIRTIISQASDSNIDKQGRIMIPKTLLRKAGIKNRVTIAGALNKFELWNPERFEEYMKDTEAVLEEAAEELNLY